MQCYEVLVVSPFNNFENPVSVPSCSERPTPTPTSILFVSETAIQRVAARHLFFFPTSTNYYYYYQFHWYRVECCLAETKAWLVAHKLKLNDKKTMIMEIRSPRSVSALGDLHIMVGEECITLSEATRNLGVFFDQHFNVQNHVPKLCRLAYAQLRNAAPVRSVLPQKTADTLVHAFITGRLDYCNALMYGLPACTISKLQRLQNSGARVVTRSRKFDHITPILLDLHWLPVSRRVTFKVLHDFDLPRSLWPGSGLYRRLSDALFTCTQSAVCKWRLLTVPASRL